MSEAKSDSTVLLSRLSELVGEWDEIIKTPAADEYERGHENGMVLCRDQIAQLIKEAT